PGTRPQLDPLGRDYRRHAGFCGRLGEVDRADLVADRPVAEDRVCADQEHGCVSDPARRLGVLQQLDVLTRIAQLVGKGAALADRLRDRAEDLLRRVALERLADGCRGRGRPKSSAVQALAKLDRDRGGGALSCVVKSLGLGLDDAAQLVDVEVRFVPGCRQNAANGAGGGAHTRPEPGFSLGAARVSTARRAIQLAPCERSSRSSWTRWARTASTRVTNCRLDPCPPRSRSLCPFTTKTNAPPR